MAPHEKTGVSFPCRKGRDIMSPPVSPWHPYLCSPHPAHFIIPTHEITSIGISFQIKLLKDRAVMAQGSLGSQGSEGTPPSAVQDEEMNQLKAQVSTGN